MSAAKSILSLRKLVDLCCTSWADTHVISAYRGVSTPGNGTLSWPGYQTGLGRANDYPGRYNSFHAADQYQFRFVDGGFLQFFYAYDPATNRLIKAKLAFFPPPSANAASEFRFDTDFQNFVPLHHPFHHFQIGAIPSFRLSAEALPAPEAFFDLVMRSFYPDYWAARFPQAASILTDINLSAAQKLAKLNGSDYAKFVSDMEFRQGRIASEEDFFRVIRVQG